MITNQPVAVEAWVDGRCFGNKGAGFGVRLRYHNHYDWIRTVICGPITTNQAELKAVEYVLRSVREEFFEDPLIILTSNRYAEMMLQRENGGWSKTASSNVDLVGQVRDLFGKFKIASIRSAGPDDDIMKSLKKINETAFKKNKEIFEH